MERGPGLDSTRELGEAVGFPGLGLPGLGQESMVLVTVTVTYEITGEGLDWLGTRSAGEGLGMLGVETTEEELGPLGLGIAGEELGPLGTAGEDWIQFRLLWLSRAKATVARKRVIRVA